MGSKSGFIDGDGHGHNTSSWNRRRDVRIWAIGKRKLGKISNFCKNGNSVCGATNEN